MNISECGPFSQLYLVRNNFYILVTFHLSLFFGVVGRYVMIMLMVVLIMIMEMINIEIMTLLKQS